MTVNIGDAARNAPLPVDGLADGSPGKIIVCDGSSRPKYVTPSVHIAPFGSDGGFVVTDINNAIVTNAKLNLSAAYDASPLGDGYGSFGSGTYTLGLTTPAAGVYLVYFMVNWSLASGAILLQQLAKSGAGQGDRGAAQSLSTHTVLEWMTFNGSQELGFQFQVFGSGAQLYRNYLRLLKVAP